MRFLNSAMHAVRGLLYCFQHEKNFLVQFVLAVIVFFAGIFFGLTSQEWLAILLSTAIVLGMEIINTAIERLCDVITTSIHPAIKTSKRYCSRWSFTCISNKPRNRMYHFYSKNNFNH